MKTFLNVLLVLSMALLMSGCFAEKSYMGKVDVIGIGAGAKPATQDAHSLDSTKLSNITVAYAPDIKVKEQAVSDTVKYVVGDALTKEYSGEPKLLVDYLNFSQNLTNKVLILDKNGVVAWSGFFENYDIQNAKGVYDYGIMGVDRMSFDEAMQKYVLDEELADCDDEKKIIFPKGNIEKLAAGFSNSKYHPFVLAKFPDISLVDSNGKTLSIAKLAHNGKPTVLVFYMSKAPNKNTLGNDIDKVADIASTFTSKIHHSVAPVYPQNILEKIQTVYFK